MRCYICRCRVGGDEAGWTICQKHKKFWDTMTVAEAIERGYLIVTEDERGKVVFRPMVATVQ